MSSLMTHTMSKVQEGVEERLEGPVRFLSLLPHIRPHSHAPQYARFTTFPFRSIRNCQHIPTKKVSPSLPTSRTQHYQLSSPSVPIACPHRGRSSLSIEVQSHVPFIP
uniref:Uncharacterized protein n=1 Tax=Picea glauca TaxID=3330 RepID=A0A117NJC2_PICGL|nr:hypothetical protein ABT39_MTgene2235 [Picea glauca]KUM48638.1 hypothetical protein ABT39_MTgene4653 [Picea glauca]KUM51348.1 hypothetical protein ABT39_MTgene1195 [Picea glauca]